MWRAQLIEQAGGQFDPPPACSQVLIALVEFAVSHSGPLPIAKRKVEVVVTHSVSTRCEVKFREEEAIILVPVGILVRLLMLLRIFKREVWEYDFIVSSDGEWHDDVPQWIREQNEKLPFHPLFAPVYDEIDEIGTLLQISGCLGAMSDGSEHGKSAFLAKIAIGFLIEHEMSHILRHVSFIDQINSMLRTDREFWAYCRCVMEADADYNAAMTFSAVHWRQRLAQACVGEDANYRQKMVAAEAFYGQCGFAIAILFALMVPQLRSITAYDGQSYSHPQVRLFMVNAGMRKGIYAIGVPLPITVMVSKYFRDGALHAISAFHHETMEFNRSHRGQMFGVDQTKPPSSLILGVTAGARISARAQFMLDARGLLIDERNEFSLDGLDQLRRHWSDKSPNDDSRI